MSVFITLSMAHHGRVQHLEGFSELCGRILGNRVCSVFFFSLWIYAVSAVYWYSGA